jgi:hypothetical protein
LGNPVYTDPPVKTKFGYHIIMVEGKKWIINMNLLHELKFSFFSTSFFPKEKKTHSILWMKIIDFKQSNRPTVLNMIGTYHTWSIVIYTVNTSYDNCRGSFYRLLKSYYGSAEPSNFPKVYRISFEIKWTKTFMVVNDETFFFLSFNPILYNWGTYF